MKMSVKRSKPVATALAVLRTNTKSTRMLLKEAIVVLAGTGMLALSARARIVTPFTPVPFTLQTAVLHYLLFTLGRRAWRSIVAYVLLGLAGLPVFAYGGGPAYVLSPTFGYLLGFVVGTAVAGKLAPRGALSTRRGFIAGLVQLSFTYALGSAWLAAWYATAGRAGISQALLLAIATGVAPFIAWDLVKMFAALALARITVATIIRLSQPKSLKAVKPE